MMNLTPVQGRPKHKEGKASDPPRFEPQPIPNNVLKLKELEEDEWYRRWVGRNTIRYERAKAAGA